MEVYLIRHTTPKVEKGICYGHTDLDVTDSFHTEVEKIKNELGELGSETVVYTSPLLRCMKLAKEINNNPIADKRLMELNFGDWEMKSWDDIDQKELSHWMNDFVNVPCPNGESYSTLYERTTSFLKDLKKKSHSKAIVVTHGGAIRSLLTYANQKKLENSFETKVNYGDIFKLNL